MSVIAKMSAAAVRAFGPTKLVELHCVCADELMPSCGDGSAKANENHTFQQASPNGDAKLTLCTDVPVKEGEEFYLIFHHQPEPPAFDGALAVVDARCNSVTLYGGISSQVDVSSANRYHKDPLRHEKQVAQFSLKMSIDNPAASIQFKPGEGGYWIGIYRASEMTMSQALVLARGA
jgi:hypothetical protein